MPAGPYTSIQVSHFSNNKMRVRISYIESSVCVEQRYRHDRLCRVPERVFYFRPSDRPCCFVVGREFVRGRQHISKSSRRVSARVLRRGCGAEGRRRCRCLCARARREARQPEPVVPEISMWARVLFLTASSLCVAECKVSSRRRATSRPDIILRAGEPSAVTFWQHSCRHARRLIALDSPLQKFVLLFVWFLRAQQLITHTMRWVSLLVSRFCSLCLLL